MNKYIWDYAYIQHKDGYYYKHKHLRRNKMNGIDPEMADYRKKQHNASIDTLTNQLKQMESDIKITETNLEKKVNERDITKDVLRLKLEDTLSTLHTEKNDLKMSPTMLSAEDLNDLGIDTHMNEPVRKISHENT